jgi:glycosyltransferase involved in cell wall biosynthesis
MVASVAKKRGIPVVYEPYAEIHAQDMGVNKNLDKEGQKKFWQPFMNMADFVIGMDNCSIGAQMYLPEEKVKVFYDACNYQAYQVKLPETKEQLRDSLGLPQDLFLVGQVGAFELRKGHDHLIHAVGILSRTGVPVGAVLCGGPGDLKKWKAIAREEGVEDRIFFFRNFSEPQLVRLHNSIDLYANLSNLSRSCGLDLSLLEAMSAGLPIVVYDHGALRSAVPKGENGIIVPVRDIPALAEAISEIYQKTPAERRAMGDKSREYAANCDYAVTGKIKIGWFEEIVMRKRSSLSIVTFANIGKKKNLKTADIMPIIDAFSARGVLGQIVCQIGEGSYLPDIISAFPKFVRYPLRLLEKISGLGLSRDQTDALFDFFASRFLKPSPVVLFYPAQFEKTLLAAKANGSVAIGMAETAHYLFNKNLNREESLKLGIPEGDYPGVLRKEGAANTFDYIIANSEFLKQTYVEGGYPADRIFVATPDIDATRFVPHDAPEKFTVLYMAYTTPLKGLHYLLEAWQELNLKDAQLILVGGYGAIPEKLKVRYEEVIRANPSINWVGKTQNPEVYYKQASTFVLPSLTEGNPRVVMEAMACGVPVITTENAPSLIEEGKTGFIVPVKDMETIKSKIKYLYDHRDIAKRMGHEGRKAIEHKKPFGEAVFEIYQEILRREKKSQI